ncbi:MAG: hypothetical protein H7Z13_20195 [Ferruginibacter sp.]|nr:hypothetical protein [Ferruginibacter sp.]
MGTEIITKILNDLTQLLAAELNPRAISFGFEKIAALLYKENLSIKKIDCKEYYEDGDLSLIFLMKNEALANGQFEQASKFRFIELELLHEKGDNEFTQLRIEPWSFEYRNNCFIFHFNKKKENQRLIANLIEGYNLVHQNYSTNKMLFC